MTKQKPSFFERLTGAQSVPSDEFENSVPVFDQDEETTIPMNEEPVLQHSPTPKTIRPSAMSASLNLPTSACIRSICSGVMAANFAALPNTASTN